ncbi:hypothetical protein [Chitinophaga pinensis]|uniref:hypothetical protein n=1 Tax=Chitinophaga pinensis TaxID=79329 RepID=UPI0039658986
MWAGGRRGAGCTKGFWWPEEAPGVQRASQYGIATIASDWATNLTYIVVHPEQ